MDHVREDISSQDAMDRFLDAVESRACLPAHISPAKAATVAMCTLVARLTGGQAHRLLDACPTALQPLFEPCIAHRHGQVAKLDDAEFLHRVADRLHVSPAHAELICESVFRAVRALLPHEVVAHVTAQLPRDLRDLWGTSPPIARVTASETTEHRDLLAEIAVRPELPSGISAADAFSAVMGILSQRLSGGEARDVFVGLPDAVRPLIERSITHRDELGAMFDLDQFLSSVADELGTTPPVAEQIILVVLASVKRALPSKEVRDVASQLPVVLRQMWESA